MGSQNIGVSMLKPSVGVEVICTHRKSETMTKNLIYSNLLPILTEHVIWLRGQSLHYS